MFKSVKNHFPIFKNTDFIYLDSASSTHKPQVVLDAVNDFYTTAYSNVHRGNCALAVKATTLYEEAREEVAEFLGTMPQNIVFTKGATEAINLVASGYAKTLTAKDEVLISIAEHHANFVPWQQACLQTGATLKVFNVHDDGSFDMDDFKRKLSRQTKIVAVTQASNILGLINPVDKIIKMAHDMGAKVLIDGAQSIAHHAVNITDLGCDFFAFSGHKIYGPTGIGVLYGTNAAFENLPPYQFGGDMIENVSIAKTTFKKAPAKFEAGTPPSSGAIGLAAALKFVQKIGIKNIEAEEKRLTGILMAELEKLPQVKILGNNPDKSGIVAMTFDNVHPSDVAAILSKENICVRVGFHCAMPIHTRFDIPVSLRVSLGVYTTEDDIYKLIKALKKALAFF
ncbi:MAG: SufS family cysteine desulfurase [Lactobacillales bacterium]|jgi:cysteine desulfurase/selenocysteine lyase|nr:SufS family cysteine desulfurase [Lactobacillales bacterium]